MEQHGRRTIGSSDRIFAVSLSSAFVVQCVEICSIPLGTSRDLLGGLNPMGLAIPGVGPGLGI